MKSLIAVIILSAAIIGGGIYCTKQTDRLTDEFTAKTEEMSKEIEKESFEKASELLDDVKKTIEENSVLLASYIDHGELNKIDLYISQLEVYLRQQEKESALVYGNTLNRLFVTLTEDYKVKLENVF